MRISLRRAQGNRHLKGLEHPQDFNSRSDQMIGNHNLRHIYPPDVDKRMSTTLLKAASSGSTVVIAGSGRGSASASVESAGHLRWMTP